MKKMNSINETFKLCQEHNIGISRRLLQTLVNNGEIPSVKAGRSILINWDGLMNYLDNHKLTPDEPVTRIRKITA
jgi:excisionase family DNA binding protein